MSNKKLGSKKLSEMTLEEKEEYINEVRRTMNTHGEEGPLRAYEKYRKEQQAKGRVTAIVDTTRIGRVQELLDKGYRIDDTSEFTGASYANVKTNIDSSINVDLSTSNQQRGVVMSIDQDSYDKLMIVQEVRAEQQVAGLKRSGIPTQTGEITIGNKKI